MSKEYNHPYLPPQHPYDEIETKFRKRQDIRKQAVELTTQWVEGFLAGEPIIIGCDTFTRKREQIEQELLAKPENADARDINLGSGAPYRPEDSTVLTWRYYVWRRTPMQINE